MRYGQLSGQASSIIRSRAQQAAQIFVLSAGQNLLAGRLLHLGHAGITPFSISHLTFAICH
jgi:hypothetical protein